MKKLNSILIMLLIAINFVACSETQKDNYTSEKYSDENEEEAVQDMKNNARVPLRNGDMSELNKNLMINPHLGIKDNNKPRVKTRTLGHMEVPEK